MITVPPQDLAVGMAERAEFSCTATGNRPPNITWIRQDGMRIDGSNIQSGSMTTTSTLTLMNVMGNDFNNYSCFAENIVADNIIETIIMNATATFTLYKASKF